MVTKGKRPIEGERRIAPNGYHYIYTGGKSRLYHHVVIEKHLGRSLKKEEMVRFKDNNKENFDPNNLQVVIKGTKSVATRMARLHTRIEELQAEYDHLEASLSKT